MNNHKRACVYISRHLPSGRQLGNFTHYLNVKPSSMGGFPLLWGGGGFCLRVQFVDLAAVAVFDDAAAKLHGGSEDAVGDRKFIGDQQHAFQFLEAGQFLIDAFDDFFV